MIQLNFCTVTTTFFGGFGVYIADGKPFDADFYAMAYNLDRSDIDPQDVHSAQDAASRLKPGEWLLVKHEVSA